MEAKTTATIQDYQSLSTGQVMVFFQVQYPDGEQATQSATISQPHDREHILAEIKAAAQRWNEKRAAQDEIPALEGMLDQQIVLEE